VVIALTTVKTTSWLPRTTVNVILVVLSLVTFVLMREGGLRGGPKQASLQKTAAGS